MAVAWSLRLERYQNCATILKIRKEFKNILRPKLLVSGGKSSDTLFNQADQDSLDPK